MPVDTDARIAEAYGTRLAEALAPGIPVLLMDAICYVVNSYRESGRSG
jgi:creatinine amidohydrolase/Fe(II)-dependent formamide hydrolase-like protein